MSDEACDGVSTTPVSQNAAVHTVQGKQALVWGENLAPQDCSIVDTAHLHALDFEFLWVYQNPGPMGSPKNHICKQNIQKQQ